MKTYLIFFGKSQDFVYHAFDDESYIMDFDTVIKDFDKLESKILTVEQEAREEILSKYVFEKNGRFYSLLKLYSLAQAHQGARLAGSIYGVALLSEGRDIKISKNNIDILTGSKDKFAKASLDGLKFNKTNFYEDVREVWKALINHKKGNLLKEIEFNDFGSKLATIEPRIAAFCVDNILNDSINLNNEILNANQLYFSTNINHLQRTKDRYRNVDTFMVYDKRKPDPDTSSVKRSTTTALQDESVISEEQAYHKIQELTKELRYIRKSKHRIKQQLKAVFLIACFFLLTTILLCFYPFSSIKSYIIGEPDAIKDTLSILTDSTQNIDYILNDAQNRETLKKLVINVKCFLKNCKIQDCKYGQGGKKHKEKALEDLETLKLESKFIDSKPVSYTPRANIGYILEDCEKLESLEELIKLIDESETKKQGLLKDMNRDTDSSTNKTNKKAINKN